MDGETDIEQYIAAGGRLSAPDNAPPRYRGEIMRLIATFVDSEMAGAAGFADAINHAPGLDERIHAARMVLEKFAHARAGLDLMAAFGANTDRYVNQHPWARRESRDADLGRQRRDGDMRLNVFHYPIEGWADAVTMNTLMGLATVIQLGELADCSYQPLVDVMEEVLPAERRHARLGAAGLARLAESDNDRESLQASVDYWHPRVADTFGRLDSDRLEMYRRFGLRRRSNESLHAEWLTACDAVLSALALTAPAR